LLAVLSNRLFFFIHLKRTSTKTITTNQCKSVPINTPCCQSRQNTPTATAFYREILSKTGAATSKADRNFCLSLNLMSKHENNGLDRLIAICLVKARAFRRQVSVNLRMFLLVQIIDDERQCLLCA